MIGFMHGRILALFILIFVNIIFLWTLTVKYSEVNKGGPLGAFQLSSKVSDEFISALGLTTAVNTDSRRGRIFTTPPRPTRFTIAIMIANQVGEMVHFSAREMNVQQISRAAPLKRDTYRTLIIYRGVAFNCTRAQYTRRVIHLAPRQRYVFSLSHVCAAALT